MAALKVGDNVNVRHAEGIPEDKYTLSVEVTEICSPSDFIGRVDYIFATSGLGAPGEVTGGNICRHLKGQQNKFKNFDIIQ